MAYQRRCCLQKPACSLVGGEEEKELVLRPAEFAGIHFHVTGASMSTLDFQGNSVHGVSQDADGIGKGGRCET